MVGRVLQHATKDTPGDALVSSCQMRAFCLYHTFYSLVKGLLALGSKFLRDRLLLFKKLGSVKNHIYPLAKSNSWICGVIGTKVPIVLKCTSGTQSIYNNSTCNIESEVSTITG